MQASSCLGRRDPVAEAIRLVGATWPTRRRARWVPSGPGPDGDAVEQLHDVVELRHRGPTA